MRAHEVIVDVPADLPPVDVDLVLISRVLTNLLENAIRHGPKNTPIIDPRPARPHRRRSSCP
jgi:two-component system sensor histidine kinase KdpD